MEKRDPAPRETPAVGYLHLPTAITAAAMLPAVLFRRSRGTSRASHIRALQLGLVQQGHTSS